MPRQSASRRLADRDRRTDYRSALVWPAVLWSDQTNRRFRQRRSRRMRSSGGHGLMPEGTGPLRDLHPQILRRGPRAGIQFAAGEAPSLRAKDTKVGCACLKVITMAGSPARRWTGRSAGCWPISRRRSAKPAKPSSPASATRAGLSLRAGYDNGGFSGATTDRPALQPAARRHHGGCAPAIRSTASSPTSSPAVRYWNRA